MAGPPGTGKTAIALAMSQELGNKVSSAHFVAALLITVKGKSHYQKYSDFVILQLSCFCISFLQ